MDTRNKIFAVVGTVAILATAGAVGALLFTQQDTTSTTDTTTTTQSSTSTSTDTSNSGSSSTPTTTTSSYKDGTYTTTRSYSVPHGDTNSIKVTVTIASGKITAVTTDNSYTDRESGMYIQDFETNVSGMMTGTSMGSMMSSRIGGASLTSSAFYDALDVIATQAKA